MKIKTIKERNALVKSNKRPRPILKKPKKLKFEKFNKRVDISVQTEDLLKLFQSFPTRYKNKLYKVSTKFDTTGIDITKLIEFMCEHNLIGKPAEEIELLIKLVESK